VIDRAAVEDVLDALGGVLAERGLAFEIAVVGGAGLLLQGHLRRSTRDIDVVAILLDGQLRDPRPLPTELLAAAADVAAAYGLGEGWLNCHAADVLLEHGLPEGFLARCEVRKFAGLTIYIASRQDQIAFKLFASMDVNRTRDVGDLRNLSPREEELIAAAPWVLAHQLKRFRSDLIFRLGTLGVEDAERKIH
jgi:hypothetical protein